MNKEITVTVDAEGVFTLKTTIKGTFINSFTISADEAEALRAYFATESVSA